VSRIELHLGRDREGKLDEPKVHERRQRLHPACGCALAQVLGEASLLPSLCHEIDLEVPPERAVTFPPGPWSMPIEEELGGLGREVFLRVVLEST
jgi:hypothetical protein